MSYNSGQSRFGLMLNAPSFEQQPIRPHHRSSKTEGRKKIKQNIASLKEYDANERRKPKGGARN